MSLWWISRHSGGFYVEFSSSRYFVIVATITITWRVSRGRPWEGLERIAAGQQCTSMHYPKITIIL